MRSFPREGLVAPSMLGSAGWRQEIKHLECKPLLDIMDKESGHVRYTEFLHIERFTQELLNQFLQSIRTS